MRSRDVIIIGAGLSGLSAGCYAQMNGYRSLICEHHSHSGGVAAAWRRGEYLIDGGIHFLMGHKEGTQLHDLYRRLGVLPACRCVDLSTFGRFIHEPTGRSVLLTADLDGGAEALMALSPGDAKRVKLLFEGARAMRGLDLGMVGMGSPPELARPLDSLRELWAMRHVLRHFVGRLGRPVAEFVRGVHDPALRSCIESMFLPQVPVYFVCMLLALLADGELCLLEGGCIDFVRAMERRYRDLGGSIQPPGTDAARAGRFLHGRAVGHARRWGAAGALLGAACRAAPVQERRQELRGRLTGCTVAKPATVIH